MKINRVANPREHRRNHKRLPVDRKPDMANESFIQNLINRLAVVNAATAAREFTRVRSLQTKLSVMENLRKNTAQS